MISVMSGSSLWFTISFIILLLVGFAFGMSSIFKKLQADEPIFSLKEPTQIEAPLPWQTDFPLLP
jgi:F0F1-type ATP synthase assembly protein I